MNDVKREEEEVSREEEVTERQDTYSNAVFLLDE